MEIGAKLKRGISRQFSLGSTSNSNFKFQRQSSLTPKLWQASRRFTLGRQSSLDPNKRNLSTEELTAEELRVPDNLDTTMQLLFLASRGDVKGVEDLLKDGADVNSIDLDGRTALHIAACEGHVAVVKLLLSRRANIDARDRWGSTAAADAKYYGNNEVYNLLRARGAKAPKIKNPMAVSHPRDVPDYEVNPADLQFRRGDELVMGSCKIAKWNGTKVSVKVLDKDEFTDPESINAFRNELTLMQKVRHPNVVQFLGSVTQSIPMMIIYEYHQRGDLGSYIQKKGRLQPDKVLKFALYIARGVNYLHECKPDPIVHCNLKPKNILLDDGGQLTVSGFGLTKILKLPNHSYKLAQSLPHDESFYMAPELYKNEVFDRSVDSFAFGFILYEMIEGLPAFHPKPPEEVVTLICVDGMRPPLKSKSKSYPPDLNELIGECWNPKPIMRPTFSEIIMRLEKMYESCAKQTRWTDNFKFPWK